MFTSISHKAVYFDILSILLCCDLIIHVWGRDVTSASKNRIAQWLNHGSDETKTLV